MIAGFGYKEVEFVGPYSFSVQAARGGRKGAASQRSTPSGGARSTTTSGTPTS